MERETRIYPLFAIFPYLHSVNAKSKKNQWRVVENFHRVNVDRPRRLLLRRKNRNRIINVSVGYAKYEKRYLESGFKYCYHNK